MKDPEFLNDQRILSAVNLNEDEGTVSLRPAVLKEYVGDRKSVV